MTLEFTGRVIEQMIIASLVRNFTISEKLTYWKYNNAHSGFFYFFFFVVYNEHNCPCDDWIVTSGNLFRDQEEIKQIEYDGGI